MHWRVTFVFEAVSLVDWGLVGISHLSSVFGAVYLCRSIWHSLVLACFALIWKNGVVDERRVDAIDQR